MKVRVKCGTGRPAVGVETLPQITLHSLRLHLVERGLASEACWLSLDGREALRECDTLAELGIVSGDLLYVLHNSTESEGREGEVPTERESYASPVGPWSTAGEELLSPHSLCGDFKDKPITSAMQHGMSMQRDQCRQDTHICTSKDTTELSLAHRRPMCCMNTSRVSRECWCGSPVITLSNAINRLMVDSGFCPALGGEDYQDANVATWRYTAIHGEVKVHLVCLQMGHLLSINATASHHQDRHTASTDMPIYSYISKGQEGRECVLLDQTELARVFKDCIAHKIMTDVRRALGLADVGTFSSLFPEIKLVIFRMLNIHSVIALSAVNRELHSLCQDPYLWKHLLIRDFHIASKGHCWKQLYIKLHKTMAMRESREKQALYMQQINLGADFMFPPHTVGFFPKPRRLLGNQSNLQLWTNTHPFAHHY